MGFHRVVIDQLVIREMVVAGWNSNIRRSNVSEIDVNPDTIKGMSSSAFRSIGPPSSGARWTSFLINWSTEASPVDN
jgi:hypothetical protein